MSQGLPQETAFGSSGPKPSDLTGELSREARFRDCRCWIYGSTRQLDAEDGRLRGILGDFLAEWVSHGEPVRGLWQLLHGRFLILVPSPDGASLSGCSMDSMQGAVRRLEQALDTRLLDSSRIFLRDGDGTVHCLDRLEFKAWAREGRIHEDTRVFDTNVQRLGALAEGQFEKPLKASWHVKLYRSALDAPG